MEICARCLQNKEVGGYIPVLLKIVEELPFCKECYNVLKEKKISLNNIYGHVCIEGHSYLGEKYLSCILCKELSEKTSVKASLSRLKKC